MGALADDEPTQPVESVDSEPGGSPKGKPGGSGCALTALRGFNVFLWTAAIFACLLGIALLEVIRIWAARPAYDDGLPPLITWATWRTGAAWGAGVAVAPAVFLFVTGRYGSAERDPWLPRTRIGLLVGSLIAAALALWLTRPPQGWYPGGHLDNLASAPALAAVTYGTVTDLLFVTMVLTGYLWQARDAWHSRRNRMRPSA